MDIVDTDPYRKTAGEHVKHTLLTSSDREQNDACRHTRGVLALNACLDLIGEELACCRITLEDKARLEGLAFEMTLSGFAKQGMTSVNNPFWERIISDMPETFQASFNLLGRLTGLLAETASDSAQDESNPQSWTSF